MINIRASYFQETEAMVERLTKDRNTTKIAILYQDDGFGRAGLAGVKKALEKRKMKLVAEGTFERNTVAVKAALLNIRKGDPEAVIMVGPYKPAPNSSSWPAAEARRPVREHLLRRLQRARQGARHCRRRRGHHPGRAVPGGHRSRWSRAIMPR